MTNIKKFDIQKQFKKLPDNEIVFYRSQDGMIHIEVLFAEINIWLTQKRIAELFGTTPQNITQHIGNIYTDGEIDQLVRISYKFRAKAVGR